jgi:hypothetical protein
VDDAWLATVQIARDCGNVASLFPSGITRLWDLPYTIFNAIKIALIYLSWRELPKMEQPPKHIWEDNDRLTAWWSEVERNRDLRHKGEGDFQSMPQNALLKEMLGRSHG